MINKTNCMDCKVNISDILEWRYSVCNSLWLSVVNGKERWRVLCVGCLELRLGRNLNHNDFMPIAYNNKMSDFHSDRLKNRLIGFEYYREK